MATGAWGLLLCVHEVSVEYFMQHMSGRKRQRASSWLCSLTGEAGLVSGGSRIVAGSSGVIFCPYFHCVFCQSLIP